MFVHINIGPNMPKLGTATWRNMAFCDVFMLCSPVKIYPGVILLLIYAEIKVMIHVGKQDPMMSNQADSS